MTESPRNIPERWALRLWSSLFGTGLEDEIEKVAEAALRGSDAGARSAALAFFERLLRSPDPYDHTQPSCLSRVKKALRRRLRPTNL